MPSSMITDSLTDLSLTLKYNEYYLIIGIIQRSDQTFCLSWRVEVKGKAEDDPAN